MKPFMPRQETSRDESEPEDSDSTSNVAPSRPTTRHVGASGRPHLVRSPPERLAELNQHDRDDTIGESTDSSSATDDGVALSPKGQKALGKSKSSRLDGTSGRDAPARGAMAELQDALESTIRAPQIRSRGSHGTPGAKTVKRVSPIREEGSNESPVSLNAVLGSMQSLRTTSTESTGSAKTIKGSVPPTPLGNAPLRTPSYPFPYVPGTPQSWSQHFHQPFTTLSPTVPSQPRPTGQPSGSATYSVISDGSTPAANSAFMPSDMDYANASEDPRFPTPNLYELVLQLNTEPGMEQWWATVTNILHDHFKAERATLIQPLDPTDIENVPWGQKATFSMFGREEFVPPDAIHYDGRNEYTVDQSIPEFKVREPSSENVNDLRPQKLHPERLRPRLEARHSYAGQGREARDTPGLLHDLPTRGKARPPGPQRTVTHAAGMTPGAAPDRIPPKRFPSMQSARHTSLDDPEFSSVAGATDIGPYAEVFATLKPLDQESRPLIEAIGVSRVLERGRIVTITRDYSGDANRPVAPRSAPTSSAKTPKGPGGSRGAFVTDDVPQLYRGYHEYEQHPPSPWTQSPAPSPAIQADEEINPFFASDDQLLDESFNPAISPKDYSQYDQVEAIGVDHASTVIHIPLVHPTLSRPMQTLRMTSQSKEEAQTLPREARYDYQRKAPIAVLSLLTSQVPFPTNLLNSLRLLGPHLATSFQTAQQFSLTHLQTVSIRHRRTASGGRAYLAPMTIGPASLESIARAELEEVPGSVSGSMTSPLDYSVRSRVSTSGSFAGTPGWDPAAHGWTASRSHGGTPALSGSEMFDNYFEVKKRGVQRSGSNAGSIPPTPGNVGRSVPSGEFRRSEENIPGKAHNEHRPRTGKFERSPDPGARRGQSSPTGDPVTQDLSRPDLSRSVGHQPAHGRRHSLLHSYGADFESTFEGLHASTAGEVRTPGHTRRGSYSEDMPPPSERLLRTIIDSVPVQIFTAQPETGALSWVNSKFLIYRGQDATQVLKEPWDAIHPEDHREFLPAWHRSLRTNQQLQQKVRLKRFDGHYRWFYVRAAPLKDKKQNVVHWIGTMMDFHEQQIAEMNAARQQETAASEAKYRALANSSPQIVFAVNKTRGVTFCNTQWLQYSGQTEAQALGVGFMEHVHADDIEKCRLPNDITQPTNIPTSIPSDPHRTFSGSTASDSSETEKAQSSSGATSPMQQLPQRKLSQLASTGILKVSRDADGRPSYSTEVRLKSRDGNYRWHLVRVLLAEPLMQHDGSDETWYGTCTDINDHKDLERDLKNTMDAKSRFLSNMSHEIRTPLNGITGMVNFLIDSSLTAEQMEHVNIIRASTEGLRGLINDILDLSKAEAGMIQLNLDWIYVRALIEEVNDLTSAMAIDKGLELNYVVEEDVPPQIKGDRFRLRQILLNIVGNAIKFTQTGEVFVRCSIQRDDRSSDLGELFIKFEVIDTGRGFTDKEADSLFKRFSQIDGSSTRQHGGTGLGLVISKQLAQLHGGDMSAKGEPGKGSTFTFYIQASLPSESDHPPTPARTPGPATSIPLLPVSPGPLSMPVVSKLSSLPLDPHGRISPKFAQEITQTPPQQLPSPDTGKDSPSVSSASSDPSLRSATRTGSLRSERSSASSFTPDVVAQTASIKLALPESGTAHVARSSTAASRSIDAMTSSNQGQKLKPPGAASSPPMFSILVIAPLKYSREATVQHIDKTLPNNVPHQITARESYAECLELLGGSEPVIFTHIVVVLQDVQEIIALMEQVLEAKNSTTAIVLISDLSQRRKIMELAPDYDYDQLVNERRLRFVFKPLKPSRFGLIFDPQREREMSLDRNQDSAQQVAVSQKQVFEELARRLGNRDKRVLLVEDNKVNQMVILKFLAKVSIKVDTVLDGVQCTDKLFEKGHDYYAIILCDLHMPNKDGYQTCKEIRQWEKEEKYPYIPIIALSANVLGDVYQKCVEAGFNSYMTKPVDFKELSQVLMTFMDPSDPSKPHELMKLKHAVHRDKHHHREKKKNSLAP